MSYSYLDKTGLALVWEKIKNQLLGKVDKIDGKGLSSNDYTSNEKSKLANIASGAQVNTLEGIQKNGIDVTITNKIANIEIPINTSELFNDSGFITTSDIPQGAAASTTVPKMNGTATTGMELAFARGDHVHPVDTSRASANDVNALSGRVDSLETAIGTGGSVDDKITAAVQNLDSFIIEAPNQAISAITIADGKITESSKIVVPTNTNQLINGAGYQTASDVNSAISSALSSAMVYKGTKAEISDLPSSGNKAGDLWHVTADGGEYAWSGTSWEELGSVLDLSDYMQDNDLIAISSDEISDICI